MKQAIDHFKSNAMGGDGVTLDPKKMNGAMVTLNKEMKRAGEGFSAAMEALPPDLKEILLSRADKTAQEVEEDADERKGIATASQESVDENNARLTAIQGAVYGMQQDTRELCVTSAGILASVLDIQRGVEAVRAELCDAGGAMDRHTRLLQSVAGACGTVVGRGVKAL